jgi:hypothetical protein
MLAYPVSLAENVFPFAERLATVYPCPSRSVLSALASWALVRDFSSEEIASRVAYKTTLSFLLVGRIKYRELDIFFGFPALVGSESVS